ncbi:hypothetical protein B0H11DRAFT_1764903, partial [Mycena galericulata]
YSASTLETGYGAHIARPLCRAVEGREATLDEEAREIIEQSMQVFFYRDARSVDKVSLPCILPLSYLPFVQYQIATACVHISESNKLETSWSFGEGIRVAVLRSYPETTSNCITDSFDFSR